ncbi:MAG: glycosyltransferase [Bacteroidota bacterium]|nr:glycosyltransferase [Bacteroidota bacterium]
MAENKSLSIYFIVPYPFGEAPSQRFRFEQYFDVLIEQNIKFKTSSFYSINSWKILYKRSYYLQKVWYVILGFLKRIIDLVNCHSADYVFIHREVTPIGPPLFEWMIAKVLKKKIIFDFDDAIWLPNTSNENKWIAKLKFHSKTGMICKWAYKISAGNTYLAAYAQQFNENVIVNPTTIATHLQQLKSEKKPSSNKVIIGWTGTHSTLKYLYEIEDFLKKLSDNKSTIINVIANKKPTFDFPFEFKYWNKTTEIDDLLKIDIGIMPLTDNEWSKGKCGFKALQFMSLGIPVIASSVGVNNQIISHGINGFLVSKILDWEIVVNQLITNKELRQSIGKNAKIYIETHFSSNSNKQNFLSLFT